MQFTEILTYFPQHVLLKSLDDHELKVARGKAVKIRPNDKVKGAKLGKSYLGVLIEEVIKEDEELIRPYEKVETVGDAAGRVIAWSIKHLQSI